MSGETWILAGFFAFVLTAVAAAGYALLFRPAVAGRGAGGAGGLAGAEPEALSTSALLSGMVRRVGEAIPASPHEVGKLRKRLLSAGYHSPSTVPLFHGLKCASALLLALVLGWVVVLVHNSYSAALVPVVGGLAFGYTFPERILRSLIKARQARIRRALPDALDLLVLCIEAGQSLDQGLVDTSVELKRAYPDLSMELALAHLELRAGASRPQALRNLAGRNSEPELRKLVNLLIQADRFGTSLGPALRVHAKYLRIRFKQQAEEAARKISVKLLFPIFFLIFPCMLMVTAGPAVLQILFQLLPMIASQ
jgi:tight adherence protein C